VEIAHRIGDRAQWSAKSTLLVILAGRESSRPAVEISTRKRARLSYVAQQASFLPGLTVPRGSESSAHAHGRALREMGRGTRRLTPGRYGFEDFAADASKHFGWLAQALDYCRSAGWQQPDCSPARRAYQSPGFEWESSCWQLAEFALVFLRCGQPDRFF